MVTGDKRVKEILTLLEDMRHFMRRSADRNMGEKQRRIVQKNNMLQATVSIDDYLALEIDPQEKSRGVSSIVTGINTVLIIIPQTPEFEYIHLELTYLTNFLRTVVVDLSSDELSKVEASANLLAQIISGMSEYNTLPSVPSPDDQDYIHQVKVSINALLSIAGVYKSIIYVLHSMHIDDLKEWATKAFWHYKLASDYVKKIDFIGAYENYRSNQKTPDFFEDYITAHYANMNIARLAYDIYLKLGDYWPNDLKIYGLFDNNISLETILSILETTHKDGKAVFKRLQDAYKRRQFDYNDNPSENQRIKEFMLEYQSFQVDFDIIQAYDDYIRLRGRRYMQSTKSQLERVKESTNLLLIEYEKLAISKEKISRLNIKEGYYHTVEQHIILTALVTVWDKNQKQFTTMLKRFDFIFKKKEIIGNLKLFLIKNLAQLYIDMKFKNTHNLTTVRDELKELIPFLGFHPHDFITTNILIAILSMLIGDSTVAEIEEILTDAKNKGIFQRGQERIEKEYNAYANALLKVKEGGKFDYDPNYRTSANALDPKTWLLPDFKEMSKDKLGHEIIYLPFNREDDKML